MTRTALRDEDYQRLLAFRTELRDFLRWSEQAAHDAGLTPLCISCCWSCAATPRGRTDDRAGGRGASHPPSQRRRAGTASGGWGTAHASSATLPITVRCISTSQAAGAHSCSL